MQHGVDGRVDVAEPEEEGVEPTRDAARRAPAVDQVDGEEAAEPIEMSSSCGVDGLRWPQGTVCYVGGPDIPGGRGRFFWGQGVWTTVATRNCVLYGQPGYPRGKGEIFCISRPTVSPTRTVEPIEVPFEMWTCGGPRCHA